MYISYYFSLPAPKTGDIQFGNIFQVVDIQRLQHLFSDAISVASIFTQLDGTPITKPINYTRLCETILRKKEKGLVNSHIADEAHEGNSAIDRVIQRYVSVGLRNTGAGAITQLRTGYYD